MTLLSLYKPKVSVKYMLENKIGRGQKVAVYLGMVVLDQINVHFTSLKNLDQLFFKSFDFNSLCI